MLAGSGWEWTCAGSGSERELGVSGCRRGRRVGVRCEWECVWAGSGHWLGMRVGVRWECEWTCACSENGRGLGAGVRVRCPGVGVEVGGVRVGILWDYDWASGRALEVGVGVRWD